MFLVSIWMEYFHAENHQCSQILDYKLTSIRKQPDNLERERSSSQLGTEWRSFDVYIRNHDLLMYR